MLNENQKALNWIKELSGIDAKLAPRIVQELGDGDAVQAQYRIQTNPYLLTEVDGIGFKKADKIAREEFGFDLDDERRHEAGNRWILESKGVLSAMEYIDQRKKLELRNPEFQDTGVEIEQGMYWLPSELAAERGLARWMGQIATGQPKMATLSETQQAICEAMGLDEIQTNAVRAILATPVMCLTGGAGCGKTHVIAAAALCMDDERKTVQGMAFAGKAADRMRVAFDEYGITGEASTIHKALGYVNGRFTIEELGTDLIVIDEASMLPNWLAWAVVKRLSAHSRIVFVGDPNQLAPIGYGTPFNDLIRYGVPRVHLMKNYRQLDQQGILNMAEGILQQHRPAPAECVETHFNTDGTCLDQTLESLILKHGGNDFESWQIITYSKKIVEEYNLLAQKIINPNGQPYFEYPLWELGRNERKAPLYRAQIRRGDKIIVIKNNSLLNIYNGQTGVVMGMIRKAKDIQIKVKRSSKEYREWLIDRGYHEETIFEIIENAPEEVWIITTGEFTNHLRIKIAGKEQFADVPEDDIDRHIQLGYVITTHKAQGSDWQRVIIMQPAGVRPDTSKRFFYTAITRAKNQLCIVSSLPAPAWWANATKLAPEMDSTLIQRLGA